MKKKSHVKFNKIAFLFLMLFLSPQFLMAQTGSVKGTVTDQQGEALPGVNIIVDGTSLGISTDSKGAYLLNNVPVGEQNLKVSFIGFKPITKSVNITEGKTLELSFTLKEDAFTLQNVEVTATRRTTNIQTTPASISAITGVQLDEQGVVDITQFIDAVPGVTSVSNGSVNRIIFRNIATSTQETGSPMSATYFNDFPISGIASQVPAIRMVDMERVEVLKGPQGTLFGRSAMGGIVRYIANKPNTKKITAGVNTYISNTTDGGMNFGGHAYLNLPITKKMAIRAVGYGYNNSGFIDDVELDIPDFNKEKTWGGRLAFHWAPTDKFTVDATYLKESMQNSYAAVTTTRDPGDLNIAGDEGPDVPFDIKARTAIAGTLPEQSPNCDFYNLKLEYDFNYFTTTLLATHTKNQINWAFDQRERLDVRSGTIVDMILDDKPTSVEESNVLELRLVSPSDKFIDWIAGFYYDDSKSDGHQYTPYFGPDQLMWGFLPLTDGAVGLDTESEGTSGEMAFYGEVGFNLPTNTRFLLGYRRSDVKYSNVTTKAEGFFNDLMGEGEYVGKVYKTEEDVNTYKVAIEQPFNKDIFAYALAASGYRPGGYNRPTPISEFSTYDSDKLWNYELGLKTTWLGGQLRANVAAYMLKYDDIQLSVQDPVTFARETKNVGKAQVLGVEFGLNYVLNEYLQFGFSGSLSNPELLEDIPPSHEDLDFDGTPETYVYTGRKGDKLPGSATESFSFSVNFDTPINNNLNIFANANYKYVGKRLNDFNTDLDVELPAYQLVNMRAGVNHSSGLSIALFADNLLDEAIIYNIDRQGSAFESVPTNRPRTIGINLSYNLR